MWYFKGIGFLQYHTMSKCDITEVTVILVVWLSLPLEILNYHGYTLKLYSLNFLLQRTLINTFQLTKLRGGFHKYDNKTYYSNFLTDSNKNSKIEFFSQVETKIYTEKYIIIQLRSFKNSNTLCVFCP